MEEEKGFYKLERGAKRDTVLFGTNIVNRDYSLLIENKDTYTYPTDGWVYYDSYDAAASGLGFDADEFREELFPSEIEELF